MALIRVNPPTHLFKTDAETFKLQFTGEEFDAFMVSTHADIQRIVTRLTNRNGAVDLQAQETIDMMALAVNEELITQERHDKIMLIGIPNV